MDLEYIKDSVAKQVETAEKITIEKLAEILVIEQFSVERAIEELLPYKDWTVIDDLVLTQSYMEDLEAQVISTLISNGSISIVAQAQKMKLPYSLLKSIVESIGDEEELIVRYSQAPDVISTKDFITQKKSKIHSALKSVDEPLAMFKLQKAQNIPEDLFYLLLEQIVKDSEFTWGTLRGKRSRAIFEPKSYKDRQLNLIKSIFESNNCISFDTIENLYPYITSPIEFIADNYELNSYIALNTCIIKKSVKDEAKATLEAVVNYCDLNDHLPPNLSSDDVSRVLETIISEINADVNNRKKLIILEGGYVTTPEFINNTVLQTKDYLRNLARSLRQKHRSETVSASKMSGGTIIKALESTGCPHNIAEKILPFTRTAVVNNFSDVLQTPYIEAEEIISADKWVIDHKERELSSLYNLRKLIYFNYKAIQQFKDPSSYKSVEKFILKNQLVEYLFHLVIYLILSQSFNKNEVAESTSLCITLEDIEKQNILDSKQQKCVITYFVRENDHKYDKTSVIEIENIIKKKDVDLFISEILVKDKQNLFKENALESDSIKTDANTVIHMQLQRQLQSLPVSANTAPQILHLTSLLIFQKEFGIPLYVSGKFVPMILAEIKSKLEPEQQQLLETAHLSIVNDARDKHLEDFKKLKDFGMSCSL